jgi:DNA-binding PadR family transcriptional regulator
MAGMRMTVGILAVLGALLDRPDAGLYGLEIVRASGLEPGTIYPILQRLRSAGWVSDRWEGTVNLLKLSHRSCGHRSRDSETNP